jgi:hypothetical protein
MQFLQHRLHLTNMGGAVSWGLVMYEIKMCEQRCLLQYPTRYFLSFSLLIHNEALYPVAVASRLLCFLLEIRPTVRRLQS